MKVDCQISVDANSCDGKHRDDDEERRRNILSNDERAIYRKARVALEQDCNEQWLHYNTDSKVRHGKPKK